MFVCLFVCLLFNQIYIPPFHERALSSGQLTTQVWNNIPNTQSKQKIIHKLEPFTLHGRTTKPWAEIERNQRWITNHKDSTVQFLKVRLCSLVFTPLLKACGDETRSDLPGGSSANVVLLQRRPFSNHASVHVDIQRRPLVACLNYYICVASSLHYGTQGQCVVGAQEVVPSHPGTDQTQTPCLSSPCGSCFRCLHSMPWASVWTGHAEHVLL